MKTKLIALALVAATAAIVAFTPVRSGTGAVQTGGNPAPPGPGAGAPRIEVVFVLDTTSSMSGLIAAAKEKIWSIASTMAGARNAPEIRMGLVAFRDRGDAYVTRLVDLSPDLDSIYATLMDFQAVGGGDTPESVNRALHDAVHRISWSQDPNVYRVVFLVGDAPPHMDYVNDVRYGATLAAARSRGIVVNTVQCGAHPATETRWRDIARLGGGRYFRVGQAGSAVTMATPFDEHLAALASKLDETRLGYGDAVAQKKQAAKRKATDKLEALASVASRARRAIFNASASGRANAVDEKDLVADVAEGRVDLDEVEAEALPRRLQAMAPAERKAVVKETARRRDAIAREIRDLAGKRSAYLRKKLDEVGGAEASLDNQIYRAVEEQGRERGLRYEKDSVRY